jgi:hypothetical protein
VPFNSPANVLELNPTRSMEIVDFRRAKCQLTFALFSVRAPAIPPILLIDTRSGFPVNRLRNTMCINRRIEPGDVCAQ